MFLDTCTVSSSNNMIRTRDEETVRYRNVRSQRGHPHRARGLEKHNLCTRFQTNSIQLFFSISDWEIYDDLLSCAILEARIPQEHSAHSQVEGWWAGYSRPALWQLHFFEPGDKPAFKKTTIRLLCIQLCKTCQHDTHLIHVWGIELLLHGSIRSRLSFGDDCNLSLDPDGACSQLQYGKHMIPVVGLYRGGNHKQTFFSTMFSCSLSIWPTTSIVLGQSAKLRLQGSPADSRCCFCSSSFAVEYSWSNSQDRVWWQPSHT